MTDRQSTHGPDCWSWGPKHYDCAVREIERLRREVSEWMCNGCNTVYPGPPQPGIWCAQCPRCGGATAPRGVIERRRLEREIERLRERLGEGEQL